MLAFAVIGIRSATISSLAEHDGATSPQGMKTQRLSRRQRTLLNCAPIDEEPIRDRSMRSAVFRARGSNEFANQQSFDRAMAALVDAIPIPAESAEWFSAKDFVSASKWTWRKMARNPAVLGVGISVLAIAGVFIFYFVSRLNDFPGSGTPRNLLTLASSTRSVLLDPITGDASPLGDWFLMKRCL